MDPLRFAQMQSAREGLMSGSGSILDRAQNVQRFDSLASAYKPSKGLTFGHVLRGAIGGAIGTGVARTVSSMFGLGEDSRRRLIDYGAMSGAALNSGYFKGGSDMEMRKHAFRLGFLRAALNSNLWKQAAMLTAPLAIPLSPDSLTAPVRAAGGAAGSAAMNTGALLGALTAPDEGDVDVAKLQLHRAMLEARLSELETQRRSRLVRQILEKRRSAVS